MFSVCAICNKKKLTIKMVQKKDTHQFVCKNCVNKCNSINFSEQNCIQIYSIEDLKQSLELKQSIRSIKRTKELENQFKEYQESKKKMKTQNNELYKKSFNSLNFISPQISTKKVQKKLIKDMKLLKLNNITSKTSINTIDNFVVIDTETTGLSPTVNEILEISAIKFIKGEPQDCLTTLLKPKKEISSEIQQINHITNEMVKNSPKIEYVINDFSNFIKGFNIVGYNVLFDIKFLHRNGMDFFSEKRKFYDVLPLCRSKFKDEYLQNYKLDTICSHLGIQRTNAHRATEDALVTGILFRDISYSKKE